MDEDIYKPPESDIGSGKKKKTTATWSPVKAIVIALVVDYVGTMIFAIIITFVYSAVLAASGVPPEEITGTIQNGDLYSTYSLLTIGAGCLVSAYAGYLCAKKVKHSQYRVVAVYCAVLTLLGVIISGSAIQPGDLFLLSLITAVSVFLGAWLYMRKLPQTTDSAFLT